MRKNTQTVVQAWLKGAPGGKRGSAIWTDGESIWSYATAIVAQGDDKFVLNRTKYSQTTTQHQNSIAAWAPIWGGFEFIEVDGLDRGVTPTALLRAAYAQSHRAAEEWDLYVNGPAPEVAADPAQEIRDAFHSAINWAVLDTLDDETLDALTKEA